MSTAAVVAIAVLSAVGAAGAWVGMLGVRDERRGQDSGAALVGFPLAFGFWAYAAIVAYVEAPI